MVHYPGAHAHHGLDRPVSVYVDSKNNETYSRWNVVAIKFGSRGWDYTRKPARDAKGQSASVDIR